MRSPKHYYGSVKDSLHIINKYTSIAATNEVLFKHDIALNRMYVESSSYYIGVKFPSDAPGLGLVLGFDQLNIWLPGDPCDPNQPIILSAKYPPDMTGGIESIYVYTDIIKHQYVGDSMSPLPRIVPADVIYSV